MAEDAAVSPFPAIDPSSFDLIVVGTGLLDSILAAGASSAGKSVLHIDPNPFYGSHFSSLPLHSFSSFLLSQPKNTPPSAREDDGFDVVGLEQRHLYSDVEVSSHAPETLDQSSRSFSLDLAGPRVLFCADPAVGLMLRSGASHHLEFKSVDGNFIYQEGKLSPVPDSREGIFRDRSLGLMEKSQLMRFFKLVREHLGLSDGGGSAEEERRISDEDLESPLVDFLQKQRLPDKIKSYRSHRPFLFC